jgi:hypothetical protein
MHASKWGVCLLHGCPDAETRARTPSMNDRCNSQPMACFRWPVSARPPPRYLRIDTPVVADVHYWTPTGEDFVWTRCVHRFALPAARSTRSYNVKLAYVAILRDFLDRIRTMPARVRHARDARTYRSERRRCDFSVSHVDQWQWALKAKKVPPKAFEAAVTSAQKSFGSTIAGTCRRRRPGIQSRS